MLWAERLFWLAIIASTSLSAAIIFADDGWRALYVTHIFLGCLLAFAFVTPSRAVPAEAQAEPRARWRWAPPALVVGAVAGLFLLVPMMTRAQAAGEARKLHAAAPLPGERIVWGGPRLSGFIVVPDGAPRPTSAPTLSFAEFKTLFDWLGSELGPLDDDVRARAPFALVYGQNVADGVGDAYMVPVSVLERPGVRSWRFRLEPSSGGPVWRQWLHPVAAAEPVATR
jgi:hypothetical protein